ncbi:DUF721 domain-containing protein [Candidatus Omnitrophota bacterium]
MRRSGTRHVKGILDGLLQKWEQGTVRKGNAVREAWVAAVNEETKKHARPVSLKKGTLMVIVENSTWLYELTLKKKGILEKFNKNYTGRHKAQDMRFRVGDMDG